MIVVGALVFLGAAAFPVSYRVFSEPSSGRRLEHIEASATAWTVAQVLFGLGAAITIGGVALLARELDGWLMQASVAFLVAGLLPWAWHLYARAVDPGSFAAGSLPMWPLAVYFLATAVGLAVFGVALLTGGVLAPWVGWVVIGSMALVFALTLITRDMVPAVYYLVTMLTGVMLYR